MRVDYLIEVHRCNTGERQLFLTVSRSGVSYAALQLVESNYHAQSVGFIFLAREAQGSPDSKSDACIKPSPM